MDEESSTSKIKFEFLNVTDFSYMKESKPDYTNDYQKNISLSHWTSFDLAKDLNKSFEFDCNVLEFTVTISTAYKYMTSIKFIVTYSGNSITKNYNRSTAFVVYKFRIDNGVLISID